MFDSANVPQMESARLDVRHSVTLCVTPARRIRVKRALLNKIRLD